MTKKTQDFDAFTKRSEEIRNRKPTQEQIDRINEISRKIEEEDNDNQDSIDISIAAKTAADSSTHI